MSYKKVIFIAYKVKTADIKAAEYMGNTSDDKDILKRCSIMKNAINIAHKNVITAQGGNSADTLKLFMAPEFYFRGTGGAYPIEKISKIMETMREETKNAKYAHWLFVFGTAIGYLSQGNAKEIFNIALVQKGGLAQADGMHEWIIYKEFISHIDFIRDKKKDWQKIDERIIAIAGMNAHALPTMGSRDLSTLGHVNPVGVGREESASGLGGQSIFTIDGITLGLEVCLDHAKGRLRASPVAPGHNEIQIHLIPSAGMTITPSSVVGIKGGLVFNVDGISPHTDAQVIKKIPLPKNNPVFKNSNQYYQDLAKQKKEYFDTIATTVSNAEIRLSGLDWLTITHKKYFTDYGTIDVFKETAIPNPVKAK
ncbi:MAG: hypothetical protein ABFD75_06005 [Smithella sp.]